MPLEIKQLPKSEVEIFVEVPAEEFDKYYKESFENIVKGISMPGFRPGKVPPEIVKKNINEGEVLKSAAEMAIQATYFSIIQEKKIEAIGKPEMTITKIARGNSFCYKVRTAILPEIKLPDYKKIARDMREKFEKEPLVEVFAEKSEGKEKSAGEEEKEKQMERLKKKQKLQMDIIGAISGDAEMEIPEILVKAELVKMVGELRSSIENMGMKWEDYLGQIKKTEEDLAKAWQDDAVRRVKYGLIIREIAEKENIQVTKEEIETEVEQILKQVPNLDKDYLRGYTYGIIRNEKVFKFLEIC